jgi:NAD(P)H dehydrogenase (quinone)
MNKIIIVYHSGFGHTQKVAQEVYKGASSTDQLVVDLKTTEEIIQFINDLVNYDTIIFGSPTYMGGPSAQFKTFADSTGKLWMSGALKNKLAAGFTNSGSLDGDKYATLMYFVTFASQHGMIWISSGLPSSLKKEGHGGTPEDINRLNSSIGLTTQSDNAPIESTPAPGDLKSAFLFGQRIAELTLQLKKQI